MIAVIMRMRVAVIMAVRMALFVPMMMIMSIVMMLIICVMMLAMKMTVAMVPMRMAIAAPSCSGSAAISARAPVCRLVIVVPCPWQPQLVHITQPLRLRCF